MIPFNWLVFWFVLIVGLFVEFMSILTYATLMILPPTNLRHV
jgi:hypothetical protein